jgi:hypothetical protein
MSKIIKLTDDLRNRIQNEFAEMIKKAKNAGGIEYTKKFENTNQKAIVVFTPKAWFKMQALIDRFDSEICWHGVVSKTEIGRYLITDILVCPQVVSGVTVNTDQEEYEKWLFSLSDDIFDGLRMQGHSHVKMSTSPSTVDLTHWESIFEQLDDDMFYIFMIWNKMGEKTIRIYDMIDNVFYESSDVSVQIEDINLDEFIDNSKKLVTQKTSPYWSGNNNYEYFDSYYRGNTACNNVKSDNQHCDSISHTSGAKDNKGDKKVSVENNKADKKDDKNLNVNDGRGKVVRKISVYGGCS